MTEKQKKLALIIGTIIIALIILLYSKKSGANTLINNQQGLSPINVEIPALNLPIRNGVPISINYAGDNGSIDFGNVPQYIPRSTCACGTGTITQYPSQPAKLAPIADKIPLVYNYPPPQPRIMFNSPSSTNGTYDAFGNLHTSDSRSPYWW